MQCFGQVNQCKSACSGGWLSSRVQSTDHGWVHLADMICSFLNGFQWYGDAWWCMYGRESHQVDDLAPSHLQFVIHSIIHQYPNRVICLRPSGQWQQVQLALWESSRTPPWCSCSELSWNETTSEPNFESIWIWTKQKKPSEWQNWNERENKRTCKSISANELSQDSLCSKSAPCCFTVRFTLHWRHCRNPWLISNNKSGRDTFCYQPYRPHNRHLHQRHQGSCPNVAHHIWS